MIRPRGRMGVGVLAALVLALPACERGHAGGRAAAEPASPAAEAPEATALPADSTPRTRPLVLIEIDKPRYGLDSATIQRVADSVPEAEVVAVRPAEISRRIGEADAFVGNLTPDQVHAARRLRWLQVPSGGVEDYGFPEIRDRPIVVTNSKIIQGPAMADHAMAMLLALTRRLHLIIPGRARSRWKPTGYTPIELRGKTAVVIGVGGAGSAIAERAAAFGMRVIGVDPKDIAPTAAVQRIVPPDMLLEVLPQANVVFMAAPLTAATHHMLDRRAFAALPPGAYLVNVSRGGTVDTEALVEALRSGRLAGAGLDVTDPEPPPKGHPLWTLENVILTPHMAGASDNLLEHRRALYTANIRRFTRGLPLLNLVDKAKGY
ncbi:MAG TPA: D-2-hydroxyacid dehydrogenase [Gemmatimonadales bacterium]|nr:D-2-hydroxyacid dehydrogenase [Gemmatimonadales bacterium]